MLTPDQARDRAHDIVARAKAAGADAADAVFAADASLDVSIRLGKLEDIGRSESEDLGLRVFVGKRSASVSTSDLSSAAMDALAARAVAMASSGASPLKTACCTAYRRCSGSPIMVRSRPSSYAMRQPRQRMRRARCPA
jgi:PmbA protein